MQKPERPVIWEKEQVIQLINAYQRKDILWNPSNSDHYNKALKNDAWIELSLELNYPVADMKKKMENIFGQLRRERMKRKCGKTVGRGGGNLQGWYAYDHLQFLEGRSFRRKGTPKKAITNLDYQHLQTNEKSSSSKVPSKNMHLNKQICQKKLNELDQITLKTELDLELLGTDHEMINFDDNLSGTLALTLATDCSTKDMLETQNETTQAEGHDFNVITPSSLPGPFSLDDSQLYANYLASKLRQYSKRSRDVLQHKISNLLYCADLGQFD